jgi:hypothetical protein
MELIGAGAQIHQADRAGRTALHDILSLDRRDFGLFEGQDLCQALFGYIERLEQTSHDGVLDPATQALKDYLENRFYEESLVELTELVGQEADYLQRKLKAPLPRRFSREKKMVYGVCRFLLQQNGVQVEDPLNEYEQERYRNFIAYLLLSFNEQEKWHTIMLKRGNPSEPLTGATGAAALAAATAAGEVAGALSEADAREIADRHQEMFRRQGR